jgi:outer membrane protein assembly factor BamB
LETERVSPGFLGGIALATLFLLLSAGSGQAQCLNGFEYAICPDVGTIFIQDQKTLGAVRISDGTLLWRTALPQIDVAYNGPVATPDSVVMCAGFPDTRIDAFDAATGQMTWHLATSSRDLNSFGSLILMNDPQYWDGITALEGRTGKKVWHHPAKPPRSANPSGSPGHILLTKQHAIDADTGQVLYDWPRHWDVSAMVLTDRLRAIGTSRGEMAVYSAGQMLWAKHDPRRRYIGGLAADPEHILIARYDGYYPYFHPVHGTLELMFATSGKTIWSKGIASNFMLLPLPIALIQGLAISVMPDSPNSSVVQAFDAPTGRQQWVIHADRKLDGDIVCSSPHCFLGAFPGEVLMLDAQSGAASWFALPKQ